MQTWSGGGGASFACEIDDEHHFARVLLQRDLLAIDVLDLESALKRAERRRIPLGLEVVDAVASNFLLSSSFQLRGYVSVRCPGPKQDVLFSS